MAYPRSNQPGALIGFISALLFLFTIGFGGPKPPAPRLSVSTEGCPKVLPVQQTQVLNQTTIQDLSLDPTPEYYYLYKISYAWYAMIGFLITLTIGMATSEIARIIRSDYKRSKPHPDLLMEFLRESNESTVDQLVEVENEKAGLSEHELEDFVPKL